VDKLRFRYSKTGSAKYISHLDLLATMQRAILRAGICLKYSEGFNPHPYLSVALPLQVGCASECELMDVRLADGEPTEGITKRLNASMPEGLTICEVYTPIRKFDEIKWIGIRGRLHYDDVTPANAAMRLTERFAVDSIVVTKRTKRGESDIDISLYFRDLHITDGSEVTMDVKISAQNPSLSPFDVINALSGEFGELKPDFAFFTRVELYDSDMLVFK